MCTQAAVKLLRYGVRRCSEARGHGGNSWRQFVYAPGAATRHMCAACTPLNAACPALKTQQKHKRYLFRQPRHWALHWLCARTLGAWGPQFCAPCVHPVRAPAKRPSPTGSLRGTPSQAHAHPRPSQALYGRLRQNAPVGRQIFLTKEE